jgi:RND family efflux transporter MFP subunit
MGVGRTASFLLLSVSLASACGGAAKNAGGPGGMAGMAMPVKVATVTVAPIPETSSYVAVLRSRKSITLQPQVEGQVHKIFVRSGDQVNAGDALMDIDPSRQEAAVNSGNAVRSSKLANVRYAEQQYERLQSLVSGGAASQQELDQAKSNLESAKADLDSLGALVRAQEVTLRYYHITAPASGVVGDIPVHEGDYVTPQTKLTTLDQNTALEAYIEVPQERAADLRPDLPVDVIDVAGNIVAQSKLSFISPQVAEDTQSILVKCLIDNSKNVLRAGQFIRARITWSDAPGPLVPSLAVTRLSGQTFVFVATPGDDKSKPLTVHQTPVVLGSLIGNDYAVRSGLKGGEQVVVSGTQKLRDGAPVIPQA